MDWYVVRVKPHRDHFAAANLLQRGVEIYQPILLKRRPRAKQLRSEPFFPGYLFARVELLSSQWMAARSAPDVAYFLGQNGYPTPLPKGFVAGLKARLELLNEQGGVPRFNSGDRVVVTRGPFEFFEAVFDRNLSPGGRSRILVQLFGRLVAVELHEDCLEKAV